MPATTITKELRHDHGTGHGVWLIQLTLSPIGVIHPLLKDEELPRMAYHHCEGVIEEGDQLVKGVVPLDQLQPCVRLRAII